jgi:hypothetical protein
MTDEETLRRALCDDHLTLYTSNDNARVFAEVDSFVAQSHGNTSIKHVFLRPYDADPGIYELWDKVGQGVGNLKYLSVLRICLRHSLGEPDWEILARILSPIQNKIELELRFTAIEGTEEMRAFARAIQGHPAITQFKSVVCFENTSILCSALTTLPNLEDVVLTQYSPRRDDSLPPASMTELLTRAPSLRIVEFQNFCFTSSICEATVTVLRQGSSITSLNLHECSFPEGGSEQIASALEENTTLTTFEISPSPDTIIHQAFYDALAESLLSNSTLQELTINYREARSPTTTSVCVSSLFLALGMNKTLRKLNICGHVSGVRSVGTRSVIPALHEGLGKNSSLEILELIHVAHVTQPLFRITAVEALQLNKTLQVLNLCHSTTTPKMTDDEVKHLTSVFKKNYGLESLWCFHSRDDRLGDLRSILRLNRAGRRYLSDGHGSVISEGVGVLSAVSDDLNCVFLHLLENPSLCNRRASLKRFRAV